MTDGGTPPPALDGVILAGGRSRRLGGRDKGLLPLAGRPLVAWVAERLAPQVNRLCISANRHVQDYASLGYPVQPDTLPGQPGPLAGILAAADRLQAPWLLAVPCDLPFLPGNLASRLLAAALAGRCPAAYATEPGREHYAVMLLHRDRLPDLAAYLAAGERQVGAWLLRQGAAGVLFDAAGEAFHNINTPFDLACAQRLAEALGRPPGAGA